VPFLIYSALLGSGLGDAAIIEVSILVLIS
jgi:hypothetical protein